MFSFRASPMVAARGRLPPPDKPWLISAQDEIDEGDAEDERFRAQWLRSHPFPGPGASADSKLSWLGSIQKCHDDEMEGSFYSSTAPEGQDVAAFALLARAPGRLVVEFRSRRSDLRGLKLNDEREARFAASVAELGRGGYGGDVRWDAYRDWLIETDQPTADKDEDEVADEVVVGSLECSKTDELGEKIDEFAERFGLTFTEVQMAEEDKVRGVCRLWQLRKLVGENLYLPEDGPSSGSPRLCVRVLLGLRDPPSFESGGAGDFREWLRETEAATKAAGDPKKYILVPRKAGGKKRRKKSRYDDDDPEDDDDGPPITSDNYHALWLPAEYDRHHNRVMAHLHNGEGESADVRRRLDKGNTDTGNLKAMMFQAELAYAKSLRSVRERFCAVLALTRAAAQDTYWMHDNEMPEEVAKMVRDLAACWRTGLLKNDDEALGVSVPPPPVAAGGGGGGASGGSREALYRILEMLAPQYQNASEYVKVRFNWKPQAPRGMSASGGGKRRRTW